jgi:hypothetical protein
VERERVGLLRASRPGGEQQSVATPQAAKEDGLAHPADTSRSNCLLLLWLEVADRDLGLNPGNAGATVPDGSPTLESKLRIRREGVDGRGAASSEQPPRAHLDLYFCRSVTAAQALRNTTAAPGLRILRRERNAASRSPKVLYWNPSLITRNALRAPSVRRRRGAA